VIGGRRADTPEPACGDPRDAESDERRAQPRTAPQDGETTKAGALDTTGHEPPNVVAERRVPIGLEVGPSNYKPVYDFFQNGDYRR
jgi:hypothetical protein